MPRTKSIISDCCTGFRQVSRSIRNLRMERADLLHRKLQCQPPCMTTHILHRTLSRSLWSKFLATAAFLGSISDRLDSALLNRQHLVVSEAATSHAIRGQHASDTKSDHLIAVSRVSRTECTNDRMWHDVSATYTYVGGCACRTHGECFAPSLVC